MVRSNMIYIRRIFGFDLENSSHACLINEHDHVDQGFQANFRNTDIMCIEKFKKLA